MGRFRPPSADAARRALPALLGMVAAGALLPDRYGAGRHTLGVAVLALRPQLTAATAAAALLAAARRHRPLAAGLGGAAASGLAACLAARAQPHRRPPGGAHPATGHPLTLLTANVLHGRAAPAELARLIEHGAPDLVALPEAGHRYRTRLMPLLEPLGYRCWVSAAPDLPDGRSVALLAGPRAGELRVRAGHEMQIPHLEATGGLLGTRTLYAAHTTAPVNQRRTAAWRHDLAVLGRWCGAPLPPLVLGDLNATVDHPALRAALNGCRTAAGGRLRGVTGTFPARLPRALGIHIDHVLIPDNALTCTFSVHQVLGSDHRAVFARVLLVDVPAGARPFTGGLSITI